MSSRTSLSQRTWRRFTDKLPGGKLSRFTVIIGGEKPNTTVIDQHIYDPSLVFDSAGVSEDRLSVRLLHVEGEC